MENNIACIKETLRSSMCDNEQIIIKKKENPVLDILDKVSKNLLDNINMSEKVSKEDYLELKTMLTNMFHAGNDIRYIIK